MVSKYKPISCFSILAVTLWMSCAIADGAPGSMPGDDAMTCEQIAAELAPYAQQMAGAFTQLAQTDQQLLARNQERIAQNAPVVAGVSAAATATTADPTGISSKIYGQTEAAMQQEAWNRALAEDKPLMEQARQQTSQAVAQAAPMQSNARVQRLMELVQQKNCH
jgi:hypothetical protein